MKNNKIYLLLIAIAFLSFSCDEDDDGDKKDKIKFTIDASKYLMQSNSKYYYDIEIIEPENKKGYYKRFTEVFGFDTIKDKYAQMYMEDQTQSGLNKKNYLYAEGSKIYGFNCGYNLSNHHDILLSNSKNELFKSILLIDFDKDKWEDYFEFEYSPYDWRDESDYKVTTKVHISGKKLSEEKIIYNGEELNSFNIELIFDFDIFHFSEESENYPKDNHQLYKRNLVIVENVGIIKDEVEIYFYEKDGKGEEYDFKYNRNFTLEKIEKLE